MGIAAIVGGLAEGAADIGIGAGLAEAGAAGAADLAGAAGAFEGGAAAAGAAGAEGAFAGGAAGLGEAGAAGSFAGGAEALGALGAEGSFAGGAGLASADFASAGDFAGGGSDFASGSDLSPQASNALSGSFEEAASSDLGSNFSAAEPVSFGETGAFADAPGAGEAFTNDAYTTADQGVGNFDYGAQDYLNQASQPTGTENAVTSTEQGDVVDKTLQAEGAQPGEQAGGRAGGAGKAASGAAGGAGGAGQFNPGQLLNALKQLAGGPSKPAALGSANAAAQQLQDQANQLLANYNTGTLNPAQMAQIRTALQGNLNKIRQYYATSGRYNSTDRIQAENNARIQAVASMETFLQQNLQLGLQSLGQAGSLFNQVANTTIQSDNAFRNSLGSALGSIMRLPMGGQASSGTPNVSTQQGDFSDSTGGGGGGDFNQADVAA